jgi:hypothetical protein
VQGTIRADAVAGYLAVLATARANRAVAVKITRIASKIERAVVRVIRRQEV